MLTGLTTTASSPVGRASTSCSASALLAEYGSVSAGGPSGFSTTSPSASMTAALLLVWTNRGTPAAIGGGEHAAGAVDVDAAGLRRADARPYPARCSTAEQPRRGPGQAVDVEQVRLDDRRPRPGSSRAGPFRVPHGGPHLVATPDQQVDQHSSEVTRYLP